MSRESIWARISIRKLNKFKLEKNQIDHILR